MKEKQNKYIKIVNESSVKEKALFGGSLLALLGFALPIFAGVDGTAFNAPYGWLLFLLTLATPIVYLFVDYKKDKLTLIASEFVSTVCIVGLILISKLAPIMGLGLVDVSVFDIMGAGYIFITVGALAQFISSLME